MIILTSGCSFTQYKWPTWANYLKEWSTEEQPYQVINVGDAGIDNSIIAYRMIDYLNNRIRVGDFERSHDPKDVGKVCVMWTGHERYCPQYKDIVTHTDLKYVGEHFHPNERLRNLAMCMDVVNLLCQTRNIECYNFFYFQFTPQERRYLDRMTAGSWNLNHTVFSMHRSNKKPLYDDIHPTPLDQWRFANEVVAPYIGLPKKDSVPEIVKEHEKLVRGKRTKFMDPDMSNYSHRDKPTYFNITKNMDPFATDLFHIDTTSTAVTNTKMALHNWDIRGFDEKQEPKWFDSMITRIFKL